MAKRNNVVSKYGASVDLDKEKVLKELEAEHAERFKVPDPNTVSANSDYAKHPKFAKFLNKGAQ